MKRKDFLKASVATAGLSIVPEMLSAKAAAQGNPSASHLF
jgi:hypothetical protein